MKVRFVPLGRVRHQGELGYAKDLPVDILNARPPVLIRVCWVGKYAEGEATAREVRMMSGYRQRADIFFVKLAISTSVSSIWCS